MLLGFEVSGNIYFLRFSDLGTFSDLAAEGLYWGVILVGCAVSGKKTKKFEIKIF